MIDMHIAKLMMHKWEEEPISGIERGYKGTFAIFFYGCNMRCVYCQNYKISRVRIHQDKHNGICEEESADYVGASNESPFSDSLTKIVYSPAELCEEMLYAEKNGAASISFITGVLYVDKIRETIILAKEKGLKIPIVYNTSSYELVSQIKKLEGLIDIYLPDFKYMDDELSKKYSGVGNYESIAKKSISEMYRQVGKENVIVRHLVLPGHTEDSKKVIRYLHDTYGKDMILSIMSQYTPVLENEDLKYFIELQRKITKREYDKVVDYALGLGMENAYIQDMDSAKEIYIPDFI